jgi:hypothetical protein
MTPMSLFLNLAPLRTDMDMYMDTRHGQGHRIFCESVKPMLKSASRAILSLCPHFITLWPQLSTVGILYSKCITRNRTWQYRHTQSKIMMYIFY